MISGTPKILIFVGPVVDLYTTFGLNLTGVESWYFRTFFFENNKKQTPSKYSVPSESIWNPSKTRGNKSLDPLNKEPLKLRPQKTTSAWNKTTNTPTTPTKQHLPKVQSNQVPHNWIGGRGFQTIGFVPCLVLYKTATASRQHLNQANCCGRARPYPNLCGRPLKPLMEGVEG